MKYLFLVLVAFIVSCSTSPMQPAQINMVTVSIWFCWSNPTANASQCSIYASDKLVDVIPVGGYDQISVEDKTPLKATWRDYSMFPDLGGMPTTRYDTAALDLKWSMW